MGKKRKKEIGEHQAINPMIILAGIMLLATIATYIIPAGTFDRVAIKGSEYEQVVAGSFHHVKGNPVSPFQMFQSLTLGFQDAAYVIAFLLILGGVFKIVESTGALHAGIQSLIKKTSGMELALVPICLVVFSGISATAACCEEYLAFLPLMYMVCMACGFDSILAVALLFGASAIGYAGGMANAFTVGVAQTIAELPMFSGMWYRLIVWGVLLVVSIAYMMVYAYRVKKNPANGYNFDIDEKYRSEMDGDALEEVDSLTGRQGLILLVFFGAFLFVAFSVIKWKFYIDEMAGIFVIVGLVCGILGGLKANEIADRFVEGAKDLVWAGLIIAMCFGITKLLKDASIMDTLVNAMGIALGGFRTSVAAVGMFVLQDLLNFLIPSGSGQAAVTMPFMVPLADVLGVSRQTSILAFQLGDAFTNVIAPTSGEIMAALAICHVPYSKWFRFMAPLWGLWVVVAVVMLVVATVIGY